jgi:hypothetical protein
MHLPFLHFFSPGQQVPAPAHLPSPHFLSLLQHAPALTHAPLLHFLSFEQQVLAPTHLPLLHFLSFEQQVPGSAQSLFAQRLPPLQISCFRQFFRAVTFCVAVYGPQRLVTKVLTQFARWAGGFPKQLMAH